MPLSLSSIKWYGSAAGRVTASPAESNGSLPPGGWLFAGWLSVLRAQRSVMSMGSHYLFTHAKGNACVWCSAAFMCLSVYLLFHTISLKCTCYRQGLLWVLEIRLFWAQKVKGQGHETQKYCLRGSWRSCECWLVLVIIIIIISSSSSSTSSCCCNSYGPSTQSRLMLSKTAAVYYYSVSNILRTVTAFPLLCAINSRCNKNSSVTSNSSGAFADLLY